MSRLVPVTVFNAPHTLQMFERLGIEWTDLSGTEGKFGIAGWQRIRTTPEAAALYVRLNRHLGAQTTDDAFAKCWGTPELAAAFQAFVRLGSPVSPVLAARFFEEPTDG